MDTSTYAAWWGAGLATVVLLWDLYKWRASGPRLRVWAKGDQKQLRPGDWDKPGRVPGDEDWIRISVANTGTGATTIQGVGFSCFSSVWQKVIRRPERTYGLVAETNPFCQLPWKLNPGEEWTGLLPQYEPFANLLKSGALYCQVEHTVSTRPVFRKVQGTGRTTPVDAEAQQHDADTE